MFTIWDDGVDYGSYETLDLAIKSLNIDPKLYDLKQVKPNIWTIGGYTIIKD